MTAPVLADALGPRARRRMLVASVIAGAVLVVVVVLAVKRLADRDQLAEELWRPLADGAVLRFLWGGLANTLQAALVSIALAMGAGALLALGRLSRNRVVRWATGAWVEFFRAVPLLLLILFAGLGLPKYGVDLDVFWYLVLALTAYNSAVLAEIFRAGILSLDRGQFEAAYSVGLSYPQAMASVIVPQAVRRMVPAVVSQLVTLLKDTSLGYVITYEELLRRGRITGEFYRNPLQSLALVAVAYVVVNFALSTTARRLESRQRRKYRAGEIRVAGIEELA